jgi:autotransporter-associated beta strand protein
MYSNYSGVNPSITLSGGILGADADYTCDVSISATTAATLKAASAANVAHNITLTAPVTGSGFAKTGAGSLNLNGVNTFTGVATVSAGRVAVNGSTAAGSTLLITNGATLGGSGTLSGAANITASGTLAPGNSIGTLTAAGAVTLGGNTLMEIDRNGGSPLADKINKSVGTLTFGGTLTVTNIGATAVSGDTFDLFDGSLSGSFTTLILPPGGTLHWLTGNLNVDGTITFTNNTPTISNATVNRGSGVTAKVKKSDLAASDLDGDTLTYMLSTSTNGATITQNADYLFIPANTVNDAFTVTVSDGAGGSASATVTVNVVTTTGQTSGNVTLVAGNANLTFYGVPGTTYTVQRSTDLSTWTDLTTVTADSNGLVSYVDVGAPTPNAYYRLKF